MKFEVTGIVPKKDGRRGRAVVEADSPQDAVAKARRRGLMADHVKPVVPQAIDADSDRNEGGEGDFDIPDPEPVEMKISAPVGIPTHGALICPYCAVVVAERVAYLGQPVTCTNCGSSFIAPDKDAQQKAEIQAGIQALAALFWLAIGALLLYRAYLWFELASIL